jgi:L-threonylcarbamoyladenylate synthase
MLSRWQLDRIQRVLNKGGVIAYPTESVFGLGCDPNNLQALEKILRIKRRPAAKGLIILVSDISQAEPFIQPLIQDQIKQLNQKQPRATTWLIPRKPNLSTLLCGNHEKLAVRITDHPIAKAICEFNNSALVSTSCNLSGRPEMKTMLEVRNKVGAQIDHVVNGSCGKQKPSQIIDLETGQILRK